MIVLPSIRSISFNILNSGQDGINNKYISIDEFYKRIILLKNKVLINEDLKLILLKKACDFKEFSKLKIQNNFLSFLKNSSYIYKFLKEMSNEQINIKSLLEFDTYAEYEDHINILIKIKENYKKILDENGYIDEIFIPYEYELNINYIKSLKEILIIIEGYLSNFEFNVLKEASKFSSLSLKFYSNEFNTKMKDKLNDFGFALEDNFTYKLNISTKKIESKNPLVNNKNIKSFSFNNRILQIAFLKEKIYEFVNIKGFNPENIAVILPDENFKETLSYFDEEKNLNFAKGNSLRESRYYKYISAIKDYMNKDSIENENRLNLIDKDFKDKIDIFIKNKNSNNINSFIELINIILDFEKDKNYKSLIQESIYEIKNLENELQNYSFMDKLDFFINKLSLKNKDDTRGGKITVMGVLESRGVFFDGVIILDFNDEFVPAKSQKDMFLNSKLREKVKLPSNKDRQNLQKYFFSRLLRRAKEVAISYVKNEDSLVSKFLYELKIKENKTHNFYSSLLFNINKKERIKDDLIKKSYEFKELSATSLKTYLKCKRQYYYKYIEKIKTHEIKKDYISPKELGTALHNILKNIYEKNLQKDPKKFKKILEDSFNNINMKNNNINFYNKKLWLKNLDKFIEVEFNRFKEAYTVFALEKDINIEKFGIKLNGRIDRIDIKNDNLYLIDYKIGNIDKNDFQLEFYYILASSIKKVHSSYFYDLKKAELIENKGFAKKIIELNDILKNLSQVKEVNFLKTDKISNCKFCSYKNICFKI